MLGETFNLNQSQNEIRFVPLHWSVHIEVKYIRLQGASGLLPTSSLKWVLTGLSHVRCSVWNVEGYYRAKCLLEGCNVCCVSEFTRKLTQSSGWSIEKKYLEIIWLDLVELINYHFLLINLSIDHRLFKKHEKRKTKPTFAEMYAIRTITRSLSI